MTTCTKIYTDIPFAHRQHNHDGHCSKIHGHNWTFKFTFGANEVDENGFVVDFGKLKWLREWINEKFDHKLVLNQDDPALNYLTQGLCNPDGLQDEEKHIQNMFPFADIAIVPNCGAEGLAAYLLRVVGSMIKIQTTARVDGPVYLLSVEVAEDTRNSARVEAELLD